MFCPECRSEYVGGVTECPDCGVALVGELPVPGVLDGSEGGDYVALLRTYSPQDVVMIRSVLDDSNIRFFIQGENVSHIRPFADPAVLMVVEDDVEDAKALLEDLPLSYYPWSAAGRRSPREEEENSEE